MSIYLQLGLAFGLGASLVINVVMWHDTGLLLRKLEEQQEELDGRL